MRRIGVLAAVIALLGLSACGSGNPEAEAAATKAAEAWLALVDAGEHAQSWDEAAAYFQGAVTRDEWVRTLEGVRGPLGEVVSRSLHSTKYATSLPGAPDGEYVVVEFTVSFTRNQSALETVTPMKDSDGTWRVSGYFVR